ncbi:MAG TPA: tRNA uridine-5-carboxymethylaminomethyl(34) synthesis enzyme MnmG [Chitinivibrionales bacterium]|nr:tRNA uridine-5-carboxymethylaminomethyl(34) synthesis enzyme MnmG [Chitinivibrionales bacterium]
MKFDIIVIGGGHAGIEAAHISALKGLKVLLVTSHLDLIAQMSCNPAIGGIAKGNIVREIDALGGLMARIADKAGIHFKMLNQTKGMAVWGNRAQADKKDYRNIARKYLEEQPMVDLLQGFVRAIKAKGDKARAVVLDNGEEIEGTCIIFAMGTFLNGIAHIGLTSFPCGRLGEPPSLDLSESIKEFGIKSGRLKTGTSPRINGNTVKYEKLAKQNGDAKPWPFSFSTSKPLENKVVCWITKSTTETHRAILENLDRSPLYTGKIKSVGPRYCPSIEDKVVRFGERDGHTLFLEPEGLDTNEMYLNGLSTSLPFDVQVKMVHSIPGLEQADILRPGYGIEYDFFPPTQLWPTLESKSVKNLYFAGQINGTSGYEEAAGQGLLAGINASAAVIGEEPLVLGRDSSYVGVLIDDLVTKGTQEPYRMFTSRAEHRLILRQDTADERLMPIALRRGLISKELYEKRERVWEQKAGYREKLSEVKISPGEWEKKSKASIKVKMKASELLKRPEIKIEEILNIIDLKIEDREIRSAIEADIKYSGFIENDLEKLESYRKMENEILPENINYNNIKGLLNESRIKLLQIRPRSLGQALRIPGVTPADITVLMVYLSNQMFHVKQR